MTAPDWAAKARERWPLMNVRASMGGWHLYVSDGVIEYHAGKDSNDMWHGDNGDPERFRVSRPDPIAAIEAAIRAEQAEARATLERLKVWNVG